jgi:GNAT superfamily N-acetyltransferase
MNALLYSDSLEGVTPADLAGFFEGWPRPPTPETHLSILQGSSHVWLAREPSGRVVGFVTALSDGVLASFLPLLEVLPEHRGRGVGSELVRRMLDTLGGLYAIDVICDADVVPFYERFGLVPVQGMARRRYDAQAGLESPPSE